MSKPGTLPRWSTDLSNATEPSSGQKDTGWTVGQDAVSDYFNWLGYWTYKWLEYFDAGIWEDDLTVTGAITFNGDVTFTLVAADTVLDPAGTGSTDGFHTVYLNHALASAAIHGMVAGVDGREVWIINADSTDKIYLEHDSGTASAGQKFKLPSTYQQTDANGYNLMIPAGGSILVRYNGGTGYWDVVSTIGCYVYRTYSIPATACPVITGATHSMGTSHMTINGTGAVPMPIRLPSHAIIDQFAVYVKKNTDTTNTIAATLYYREGNSDTEQPVVATPNNNSNAPGYVTLGPTGVGGASTTVADIGGKQWWIRYDSSGNTSPSADLLLNAEVYAWTPV